MSLFHQAVSNGGRTSAFGISIFIYILVFSYKLTVLNGFSLTVCKCIAVTFSSSSFEWGEGRGGGRTSAKVGSSAKFELTCHFMLCFTEGLFVLHTEDLIKQLDSYPCGVKGLSCRTPHQGRSGT